MTGFREDILAQPDNLRRSAAVFLDALGGADLSRFEEGPLLFTGMGASLFAVVPAASAVRAGGRAAWAMSPAAVLESNGGMSAWAFVGVSQSGRSTETIDVFRRLTGPRLALTNTGSGPLADAADLALPIGSADDAAISVLTHTASLFAAASLTARLGGPPLDIGASQLADALAQTIEQAEVGVDRFAGRLDGIRALDVSGGSAWLAAAGYTALMVREGARVSTAWFETHQYLHGPIEVAEPGVGAIVFGDGREVPLAQDLAAYGVPVLLVTQAHAEADQALEVLRLPRLEPLAASVVQPVPGQWLAEAMGRRRGIAAGAFRHHQENTKVQLR